MILSVTYYTVRRLRSKLKTILSTYKQGIHEPYNFNFVILSDARVKARASRRIARMRPLPSLDNANYLTSANVQSKLQLAILQSR
jgi:hypothetical protein